MQDKKEPYYLVWNPNTGQTRHKHMTLQDAKDEARRLARNNRGEEFVVLTPCVSLQAIDVVETEFDEIPF